MRAVRLERVLRLAGYTRFDTECIAAGKAYLAERKERGALRDVLWAAGRDGDHLEIAQNVTFHAAATTRAECRRHARELALEFLIGRDYGGDPNRQ
jgi:hypothetical protein